MAWILHRHYFHEFFGPIVASPVFETKKTAPPGRYSEEAVRRQLNQCALSRKVKDPNFCHFSIAKVKDWNGTIWIDLNVAKDPWHFYSPSGISPFPFTLRPAPGRYSLPLVPFVPLLLSPSQEIRAARKVRPYARKKTAGAAPRIIRKVLILFPFLSVPLFPWH